MKLEKLNLTELDAQEVRSVEGGFVPLVIFGISISAKAVAAAGVAAFGAGVGLGAAAYLAD
ncbi:class IIb bacteriocin, lactobin A/cerein 7B family [Candidatus Ornithobacterium hominis]|uniref:Class IIb bacteriocin, lactobin A/cerein 7B family n=1 Tax=Candidatus Ornithobacterium hominis TaxID=2497989 RepID=A0A383U4N2_9FLAO|nr:class IIb bacteriocin, lactobin A/cerein 7B family [Candidatus Ornithobacterium hominis]MCT7904740.1 class IIb bacteriocin, lactobin A/cerein 7B family [Candidatus Ornithobacterium hominis]CAI9429864.1 Class IIb bacteriocin, lactobin A/cerein 7B family [Candidatus Ornithobacterium hominis]SZD73913.1 class IIb bacteriocin, lactobin A/cerein 7B family [Candidatus Ornithobacterium hominis]